MPRITFYISDEDKKRWYEKFKERIGESASSFFVDAIKKYVIAKEIELTGMTDIFLQVGDVNMDTQTLNVKQVTFVGQLVARGSTQFEDDSVVNYQVYRTRKEKILVYSERNFNNSIITFSYEVFDTQTDFFKTKYPPALVKEVLDNLPEVQYEVLDV